MKIAITGGSGFIGTHLVNLLKKEHDILILDREPSKI
ncbi:MAG: epimerase, partial [Chloroflexi bacterium]|nr:epimerase [Chloroflexota bacterium]